CCRQRAWRAPSPVPLHDALPISAANLTRTSEQPAQSVPWSRSLEPVAARRARAASRRSEEFASRPRPCPLARLLLSPCRLFAIRSEEHTSELQSRENLVCRLLLA